jgi:hypothetical protein
MKQTAVGCTEVLQNDAAAPGSAYPLGSPANATIAEVVDGMLPIGTVQATLMTARMAALFVAALRNRVGSA